MLDPGAGGGPGPLSSESDRLASLPESESGPLAVIIMPVNEQPLMDTRFDSHYS